MTKTAILLLAAGVCLGCNGGTSPTEIAKRTPPSISNLSNPATATLSPLPGSSGQRPGELPISFDFKDPDGDLDQVIVTFPEGPARNPLNGVAGQQSGRASLLQSLLLPAAGTRVAFTVQVIDRGGNFSNTLSGSFTAP
jgi:hypothetical protein